MTILLVEDDQDDIDFFKEAVIFIHPEITVLTAYNGLEALKILEQGIQPDHIFLDINMPLMNGLECLQQIQIRFPSIISSLTILSSSQKYKDHVNEMALPVHYFTKPSSFDALTGIIRKRISSENYQLN